MSQDGKGEDKEMRGASQSHVKQCIYCMADTLAKLIQGIRKKQKQTFQMGADLALSHAGTILP